MLFAGSTSPVARCSIHRLDQCENANALIWDKSFDRALAAFLGKHKTEFLYDGGRLTDEAEAVLGGPPDSRIDLDQRYLFTACRAHSCHEKGAAVVRKDGQIDAIAIVWYPCAGPHRTGRDCPYRARLSIFMRDPTDTALIARLESWTKSELASYESDGLPPVRLERVNLYRRPDPIR